MFFALIVFSQKYWAHEDQGEREGGGGAAVAISAEMTLNHVAKGEKKATYHNINIRNAFSGKVLLNGTCVIYIYTNGKN